MDSHEPLADRIHSVSYSDRHFSCDVDHHSMYLLPSWDRPTHEHSIASNPIKNNLMVTSVKSNKHKGQANLADL